MCARFASRVQGLGLAVTVLLAASSAAYATIIDVNSDLTNEWNNQTGTDTMIPADPSWTPIGVGYEWVSYATAQYPPAVVGNITLTGGNTAAPTAIFTKSFTLPDVVNTGSITIWADDTARVYLDGMLVIDANPTIGSHCVNAPVGCVPGTGYTFDVAPFDLGAGVHTLTLDAYQLLSGTPFGVMYTGQIDSEPRSPAVPEPASYLLMGLGLAGIAILIPRARRS
jgi:PEP-CTERM motif